MATTKLNRRPPPVSRKRRSTLLEALPGALFVIDGDATIVYANMRAQIMTGVPLESLHANSFWNGASQLVSPVLYQAVQKTRQTREPTEVAYVAPLTQRWLHAALSPTDEGLAIFLQDHVEPLHLQESWVRNEQTYRDLLESFSDGVTIVSPDGLVLDINQRPLDDAHLRREEVVGKPFTDLPAWSSDPAVQQQLQAALTRASQGETVRFEARIHPRIDLYLDILMMITSHRDANQQVEYLICTGRDITERKRAEDELLTLVDALPHFIWIARPDGSITYNNHRLIDYLAMSLEQVKGDGWLARVHPDDRARVQEMWQTAIQTGMPYEVEHRLQDGTSGAYRWFLVRSVPQKDAQGTILHWVGTCTDIEEQKQAEERIKASEQNFRLLAEAVPQLVWTMWPDGRLEYTNQRYREVTQANLNLEGDELWRRFVHPEDIERALALRHRSLKSGDIYENEYRILDGQTGTYRWFLARALPVRDEAGQVVKWFGTTTDIDEQKRMEEALLQGQERTNALMNSSFIGIFISEGDKIVEANDTFLRMTGYSQEDLHRQTMSWLRMTPPEYLARTQQARQELMRSQLIIPYEKEYICKDGSRLPVLVGGVALPFDPSRIICFVLDNSARKELEQRKDDFINMASHELRNPLTVLKMQTQLVRRRLEKQSHHEAAAMLSLMEGPVKQLERLIAELLDVSKIQARRLVYRQERVDLDDLLREITDTMHHLHPSHTLLLRGAVQTNLLADRDRLGQVFTNLISNALKYSPGTQTIEIDLDASEEAVRVSIRDHGLGIPREQREKIFERFYRITGSRQGAIPGLGMGLYIVEEIVKHYGGTITVESEVGKGSTFTVTLPKTRDA
jgi:PAS domain S-box-containing protein